MTDLVYSRNGQKPLTEAKTITPTIGQIYAHLANGYHIPKAELIDGTWYEGKCRNSKQARWSGKKQRFEYIRTKFDHKFLEEISAPEDDVYYDTFYAIKRIEESEVTEPITKKAMTLDGKFPGREAF